MDKSKPSLLCTTLFVTFSLVVLGVFIASIVIGASFLRDCPVQPYIPVYLIVLGVFVLLVVMVTLLLFGFENGWFGKGVNEYLALPLLFISIGLVIFVSFILYLFVVCWFITGSVWIYSVHSPSYDPTDKQNYCNKTLYLFAFWLNTVCYGCLALLLLCSGCTMLYICVKNTFQRPQPLASYSQQQA